MCLFVRSNFLFTRAPSQFIIYAFEGDGFGAFHLLAYTVRQLSLELFSIDNQYVNNLPLSFFHHFGFVCWIRYARGRNGKYISQSLSLHRLLKFSSTPGGKVPTVNLVFSYLNRRICSKLKYKLQSWHLTLTQVINYENYSALKALENYAI